MRTPKKYSPDTVAGNFWRTLDRGYSDAYSYQNEDILSIFGGYSSMNVLNATRMIPPFGYRVGITSIGRRGLQSLVMLEPLKHHGYYCMMDDGWCGNGGNTLEATQRTRAQNKYEMVGASYDLVEWYGPFGNNKFAGNSVYQWEIPEQNGFSGQGWGYQSWGGNFDTSYLWGHIMRCFYDEDNLPDPLLGVDFTRGTETEYNSGWPGKVNSGIGGYGDVFKCARNNAHYVHSLYREPTGYLVGLDEWGQGFSYQGV